VKAKHQEQGIATLYSFFFFREYKTALKRIDPGQILKKCYKTVCSNLKDTERMEIVKVSSFDHRDSFVLLSFSFPSPTRQRIIENPDGDTFLNVFRFSGGK